MYLNFACSTNFARLSSSADTVTVSIAEAQAKTAAALKQIGWDDEDAGLQAEIMTAAEEIDAWDDEDFEQGYYQFDKDRSGFIDAEEFDSFVKRFADL